MPATRGRRVGTEAIVSLTEWAFVALGLGRVQAFVASENLPALRLAESAGFRHEGVLRSYWEVEGGRLDVVVLARVPGDGRDG